MSDSESHRQDVSEQTRENLRFAPTRDFISLVNRLLMSSFTCLQFLTPSITATSYHFLSSVSYSNRLGPLRVTRMLLAPPDGRGPPNLLVRLLLVNDVRALRAETYGQHAILRHHPISIAERKCCSPARPRRRRSRRAHPQSRSALYLRVCYIRHRFRKKIYEWYATSIDPPKEPLRRQPYQCVRWGREDRSQSAMYYLHRVLIK